MTTQNKNVPTLRFPEFSEDWQIKSFGEITIKVGSGSTPTGGAKVYQNSGIIFIRSQNVIDNKLNLDDATFISEEVNLRMKGSIVKANDILLNITGGSIGRSCVVPNYFEIGNVNQHVCIIRLDNQNTPLFLQSFISSEKGQKLIFEGQTGSGREGLNFQSIRAFKVNLPTLPEQQKIAAFLTAVDEKIHQLAKKKDLLEQYKKGVMQKIFNQEIRFKDDNGNDFADWEEKKIEPFLKLYVERVKADTDIPILTSSRNGLFMQKDYFADRELDNEGEYGVVPKGYFTYRHMSDDSTFKFNINHICDKGAVSKEYPVFTTQGMDSHFLQLKLNEGDEFKRFAIEQKRGGTRTRLYFNKLTQLVINMPSLPEQQKIVHFLSAIDDKINLVNQQLEKTKEYKKGLLQQMFV